MTALDGAHAAMERAPEDEATRLAFYSRVAEVELVLMLANEADGDVVEPKVFELETGRTVLAFDSEERLAEFAGEVPYLALPGRRLAYMLAGQGLALGLNLGVAASAFLMPPKAVQWLAETSGTDLDVSVGRIEEVRPPAGLPEAVVANVDAKLARAEGLARSAYLAAVTYKQGERGHILAIVDPIEGAEAPLATEISEALRFSGNEVGSLDVVFVRSHDPIAARLARVGLKFDLPKAQSKSGPAAPGFDPDAPPRLK